MKVNIKFFILFFILFLVFGCKNKSKKNEVIEWNIASLLKEKSNNILISGNPKVVSSPYGDAVSFNGIDDAFFITNMPIKSSESFTVEMIFKPEKLEAPFEQRIVHIGEVFKDRMLLEIRAVKTHWYFDGFVASGENKKALIDDKLIHKLGAWYHVALVVSPNHITTYVNGIAELQEPFPFKPISTGRSSIGVRLNKKSWFKGSIYKVKITNNNLMPDDFMSF